MERSTNDGSAGARLSGRELAAWRGMLRVHTEVTQSLDAELRAQHGITLTGYEVLLFLEEAEGRRMRMTDLASRVLLTRSGITRSVDRLVKQGLVTRAAAETDGRGLYAELTDSGAELLEAAGRTHRAGIRREYLDHLSAAEQTTLGDVWSRLGGASAR